MTTIYDAAWKRASRAIDTVYGEPLLYQPMKTPPNGGRVSPDTGRGIPVAITGAVSASPLLIEPIGKRTASNTVTANMGAYLWIDIANDALPYLCRDRDRILRVATSEVFEVSAVQPDGIARTVLRVVLFKGPTT